MTEKRGSHVTMTKLIALSSLATTRYDFVAMVMVYMYIIQPLHRD